MTTKIRVIVLDGVDWQYVVDHRIDVAAPLWALVGMAGEPDDLSPNLISTCCATGCAAMLRACPAPITPAAVAALLCGRDSGISWFTADHYASSQELIRTRPWFSEVARNDMTVGLCNVPLTWPAFSMPRGSWVVSGFPVDEVTLRDRNRGWHHPVGLDVTGYPIEAVVRDHGPGGSDNLARLRAMEERIVDWFVRRAPPATVEVVWLRSSDSAGHHAWGTSVYDETIAHVARMAARISTERPAGATVVISDHGFDARSSPRCATYMATTHGEAAERHRLPGAHSDEGILFAFGDRIHARGLLPDQRLVDVAGGIFDVLQIPPAPGMVVGSPDWSSPSGPDDDARVRARLAALGYVP